MHVFPGGDMKRTSGNEWRLDALSYATFENILKTSKQLAKAMQANKFTLPA